MLQTAVIQFNSDIDRTLCCFYFYEDHVSTIEGIKLQSQVG